MTSDEIQQPATGNQPWNSDFSVRRIREYELREKIGQGGMGCVFRASHTMLDRPVAIKLLPAERTGDEQFISRFRREMKAVGKLRHPNIGQERGHHFLVMELVDGLDVAEIQKHAGALSVPNACEIVRHAAVGLQHAYEHGMVHRDVKPSNLLLDRCGQIKVLDLGLALLHESDMSAHDHLTGTGQIMGTLDYMAPEQAVDTHSVDIRADIYSLGCTLYSLLTGAPPFSGPQFASPARKLAAHMQKQIPAIEQQRNDIPPELSSILQRMLARDPADRFDTPGNVAETLLPFVSEADLPSLLIDAENTSSPSAGTDFRLRETSVASPAAMADTMAVPMQPRLSAQLRDPSVSLHLDEAAPDPQKEKRHAHGKKSAVQALVLTTGLAGLVACSIWLSSDDDKDGSDGNTPTVPESEAAESAADRTGRPAFALWFDGDGDFVEVPSPLIDGRYPFTIEAWVTPSSAGHNPVIGCLNGDGGALLRIYDRHWAIVFRDEDWQSNYESGVPVRIGQRAHVAMVYDKVEVRQYVDGKLSQTLRANGEINIPPDLKFRIGAAEQERKLSLFFDGQIDAVRVSRAAKYQDNFNPGALSTEPDTLARYDFSDGDGVELTDVSGNGAHGKIVAAKWLARSRK